MCYCTKVSFDVLISILKLQYIADSQNFTSSTLKKHKIVLQWRTNIQILSELLFHFIHSQIPLEVSKTDTPFPYPHVMQQTDELQMKCAMVIVALLLQVSCKSIGQYSNTSDTSPGHITHFNHLFYYIPIIILYKDRSDTANSE